MNKFCSLVISLMAGALIAKGYIVIGITLLLVAMFWINGNLFGDEVKE